MKRSGRLTLIKPFPEALKRLLTFRLTPATYDAKRGKLNFEQQTQRMYKPDPEGVEGRWVFPAGFTYRVSKFLMGLGYEIDYEDIRDLNLQKPNLDMINVDMYKWQREAFSCVVSSPGGLIQAGTATGKTILIGQICRTFDKTNIVVTSGESPPLDSLYNSLREDRKIRDDVAGFGVVGYGSHTRPRRITICHFKSLLKAPIDKCSLLLCDEVHGAPSPVRAKHLSKVSFANMFGFSASPTGRLDKAEPIMEGLFGPILYQIPHREAVKQELVSPVSAHIYRVKGQAIQADKFILRNRYGIVRNNKRNREIARIVSENYSDKKILIIAQDNLEHVFRLKKLLPDFVPVYGANSMRARYKWLDRHDLIPEGYKCLKPGGHFAVAELFRQNKIRKVISTSVWDTGIDLPDLQVLVRADARSGEIPAIQLPGRVTRKKAEGGILVDFIDDFGPALTVKSQKRVRLYKKIGYNVEYKELP